MFSAFVGLVHTMPECASEMAFVLVSFRFTCLHICSNLRSVLSWSLPSTSYPIAEMSSAMPNTFGNSLNISSIFVWNICPFEAAPNSNLLYLYLPNWYTNVIRYDDFLSDFRL